MIVLIDHMVNWNFDVEFEFQNCSSLQIQGG